MASGLWPRRECGMGSVAQGGRHEGFLWRLVADESGQGTTEYAIVVGVLVVIAIVSILAFRDRVASLWEAIASSINQL